MKAACFVAAMGWAFVGSLLFGLGVRPVAPGTARGWLAVEVLIGLLALASGRSWGGRSWRGRSWGGRSWRGRSWGGRSWPWQRASGRGGRAGGRL